MARSRRRFRGRSLRKPASAFAQSVGGSGRTLTWEMLAATPTPIFLDGQFNNFAFTSGGIDTRYVILLPQNLTRGAITLVRIRGQVVTYFDQLNMELVGGDTNSFIMMMIQLVPIANGVIQDAQILSAVNTADLESNRILWRRMYTPDFNVSTSGLMDTQRIRGQIQTTELDVKVKRRFQRDQWALVMSIGVATAGSTIHRCGLDVRGLFLAPDGL